MDTEADLLPPVGFIAVDCHFERPPGDPFNGKTWPFPLIREQAEGSQVTAIVTGQKYDSQLIDNFVAAGQKLAEKGCVGLLTSCGFLAMAQPELASRLPIPIATSSLIQIPSILPILPPTKKIAILTYDGQRLNPLHLSQIGISESTARDRIVICGVTGAGADEANQDGHLQNLVARGAKYVHADIEADVVRAALKVVKDIGRDELGAIVLECTQLPPFADAVQKAVGKDVMVFDVFTMGCWFYGGLVRRRPKAWGGIDN